MEIYKITNLVNNKVYIGQFARGVQQRFNRHISDAMTNRLDTHFARAIRKYGSNNFVVEVIDTADTQDELNQKEQYWIQYYDSIQHGYNETDATNKCGGNTYMSKTPKEMRKIGKKIRVSKLGGLNPHFVNSLYLTEWNFAYLEDPYDNLEEYPIRRTRMKLLVTDLNTQRSREYPSLNLLSKTLGVRAEALRKRIYHDGGHTIFRNYQIDILD